MSARRDRAALQHDREAAAYFRNKVILAKNEETIYGYTVPRCVGVQVFMR